MTESFQIPIAFMIFNRPEVTFRVFEKIAAQKPKRLLIVADGPRSNDESNKCQQARSILNKVDWDCEVLTNFSDVNLGCKRRMASGLDWVFSVVDEAIILEDDCLPSDSFFSYCAEMLERYKYDERVMVITGTNLQQGMSRTPYSYYFSKLNLVWGWASWKRAWLRYDVNMATWPEFRDSGFLRTYCDALNEEDYWKNFFDTAHRGAVDTWDFQWLYACWAHSGLTITPDKNLISNIGFGPDATHTTTLDSPLSSQATEDIWSIEHPNFMARNKDADQYAIEKFYLPPKSADNPTSAEIPVVEQEDCAKEIPNHVDGEISEVVSRDRPKPSSSAFKKLLSALVNR